MPPVASTLAGRRRVRGSLRRCACCPPIHVDPFVPFPTDPADGPSRFADVFSIAMPGRAGRDR